MGQLKGVKKITIEIEYRTKTDLKSQLMMVLENARKGKEHFLHENKLKKERSEYYLRFMNDFNFKDRLINGKLTRVIQSKINK